MAPRIHTREPVARRRKESPDAVDILVNYGPTQQRIIDRFIEATQPSRARVLHVFDLCGG